MTASLGILIFDDVEVLDFCGPFEVFSVTRNVPGSRQETVSPYDVKLIGIQEGTISTRGGMQVTPHVTMASCPPLDVLVVPGGWGVRRLLDNEDIAAWLRGRAGEVHTLASVCTGSLLLGAAGLLEGRTATTHFGALDNMAELLPGTTVDRERHFIRDGDVWTAAGIAAGIDLSLRIVADHHGEDVARETAKYMEYPYPETDRRRIEI